MIVTKILFLLCIISRNYFSLIKRTNFIKLVNCDLVDPIWIRKWLLFTYMLYKSKPNYFLVTKGKWIFYNRSIHIYFNKKIIILCIQYLTVFFHKNYKHSKIAYEILFQKKFRVTEVIPGDMGRKLNVFKLLAPVQQKMLAQCLTNQCDFSYYHPAILRFCLILIFKFAFYHYTYFIWTIIFANFIVLLMK